MIKYYVYSSCTFVKWALYMYLWNAEWLYFKSLFQQTNGLYLKNIPFMESLMNHLLRSHFLSTCCTQNINEATTTPPGNYNYKYLIYVWFPVKSEDS